MKKISQSIITKRVLWTLFFLFIYCLGNQLVLPFVDLKNANIFGGTIGSLAFSSAMMGGKPQVHVFFQWACRLDVGHDSLAVSFSRKWV